MAREENPFYEAIGQISSSLRKKVFGTTSKAKPKTITKAQRAALASDGGFSKLLKAKKDARRKKMKVSKGQGFSTRDRDWETGGTVADYVRLNADYSQVDDVTLLKEYYKTSKPHLNSEEIEFLLNDEFAYDEEEDDEKTIRKRKLGIKEEVAKAKKFLEDTKSKYYDEIIK